MTNLKNEVNESSKQFPLKNTISAGLNNDPIELKINWEVLGVGDWGLG
jgi:hypothetical protein